MERAFQLTLPGQQALGALSQGLQQLERRLQEEAEHVRTTQLTSSETRATAQVFACFQLVLGVRLRSAAS